MSQKTTIGNTAVPFDVIIVGLLGRRGEALLGVISGWLCSVW